jgi:hypothetical protein
MQFYVVVENGEIYPHIYLKYASAVDAVKEKHAEMLKEQIKEARYLSDMEEMLAQVNVPENLSGVTYLYIEKGINIRICLRTVV